jgi:glycosyltransferase involved in cell wall biosynthesis
MAAATATAWPAGLRKSAPHPPVSILTPTYNRRKFIPWLIECIRAQTYPRAHMEWLIYDDGTDKILDLLTPHMAELNIRYFSSDEKVNIGTKRNRLNEEARGTILVCMDDDDYYPPERVAHAVGTIQSRKVDLVGSTRNHLYFTDDASIWEVGPYGPNHATFGTMAYTKALTRTTRCDETVAFAEEMSFTKNYTIPVAQLDPMKVMLVMCHSENTFNKEKLRTSDSPVIRKTALKLRAFIRKAEQREFYAHA